MSWMRALLSLAKLFFVLFLIMGLGHTLVRYYGLSQTHSRLDHEVIRNINNIIHLDGYDQGFVLLSSSQELHEDLSYTQKIELFSEKDKVTPDPLAQCFFIWIHYDTSDNSIYDDMISPLKDQDCVFIQTSYSNVLNYFRDKKPRWFYGVRHSEWLRFVFMNSIGLETAATLKADFILLDQSPEALHPRLLSELKRRKYLIFVEEKNNQSPNS